MPNKKNVLLKSHMAVDLIKDNVSVPIDSYAEEILNAGIQEDEIFVYGVPSGRQAMCKINLLDLQKCAPIEATSDFLRWDRKHGFRPDPVAYTNIGIDKGSLQKYLHERPQTITEAISLSPPNPDCHLTAYQEYHLKKISEFLESCDDRTWISEDKDKEETCLRKILEEEYRNKFNRKYFMTIRNAVLQHSLKGTNIAPEKTQKSDDDRNKLRLVLTSRIQKYPGDKFWHDLTLPVFKKSSR